MNQLEQLKKHSIIVADSGDAEAIKHFHPQDATTNPSLILKASHKSEYAHLIERAKSDAGSDREKLLDLLFVNFGIEILKIVPGRVSIEVDAKLSFDTKKSIERARHLIELFEKSGVDRKRVLIKLASTWEGIRAAEILEKEQIHCNMTLLFSLTQAMACAEAKATLISPFVGRILDWHKMKTPDMTIDEDPGVAFVREVYAAFKSENIETKIMAASFRNTDEIGHLAGCDLLTISPALLQELENANASITPSLTTIPTSPPKLHWTEPEFRFALNENAMATEKLAEGIRLFDRDYKKLQSLIDNNHVSRIDF